MRKIFWLLLVICSCCNAVTCYNSILIKTAEGERSVTRIQGQLFYQSTGQNSKLKGIFFPFYGILSYQDGDISLPFWFIKPGAADLLNIPEVPENLKRQFSLELSASGKEGDIWNRYWYSDFGQFMRIHSSEYIENKLKNSEAMLRLGSLDNAKTSYRITNSRFSENLHNEFIAEINSYFENKIRLKKDLTINTESPQKIFSVPKNASFTTENGVANQINNYIKSSSSDWHCSSIGCCGLFGN